MRAKRSEAYMFDRLFHVNTTDEDIATRGRLLKGTALLIFFASLAVITLGLQPLDSIRAWSITGSVAVFSIFVFGLAHYGYVRTGGLLLSGSILASIMFTQNVGELVATRISLASILPALIVGLVVNSNAMLAFGTATLVARLVAQTVVQQVQLEIVVNDVIVLTVSLSLLWLILRTLERAVERSNQRAAAALEAQRELEQQQQTLQTTNTDLSASNAQMTSLLNLVRDLETPVIPLLEGVLVLPLIGHVDTRRASELTNTALNAVHEQRARMVIVDITGVSVVDTAVAQRISHLAQAVRLLGARVLLTGIRSDVAHTIVAQGIDFSNIQTAGRLQDGIASVLSELNIGTFSAQKNAKLN